jgi:hypothetical protein
MYCVCVVSVRWVCCISCNRKMKREREKPQEEGDKHASMCTHHAIHEGGVKDITTFVPAVGDGVYQRRRV